MINPKALTGPIDDPSWRCSRCQALVNCEDALWRWAGDHWQHKCPDAHPQAGHFAALREPT